MTLPMLTGDSVGFTTPTSIQIPQGRRRQKSCLTRQNGHMRSSAIPINVPSTTTWDPKDWKLKVGRLCRGPRRRKKYAKNTNDLPSRERKSACTNGLIRRVQSLSPSTPQNSLPLTMMNTENSGMFANRVDIIQAWLDAPFVWQSFTSGLNE